MKSWQRLIEKVNQGKGQGELTFIGLQELLIATQSNAITITVKGLIEYLLRVKYLMMGQLT